MKAHKQRTHSHQAGIRTVRGNAFPNVKGRGARVDSMVSDKGIARKPWPGATCTGGTVRAGESGGGLPTVGGPEGSARDWRRGQRRGWGIDD